jgi:hypothetical protein
VVVDVDVVVFESAGRALRAGSVRDHDHVHDHVHDGRAKPTALARTAAV